MSDIVYNADNLNSYELYLDPVLETTLKTMHFSKKIDRTPGNTQPHSNKSSSSMTRHPSYSQFEIPSELLNTRKPPIAKQVCTLLKNNMWMMKELIVPLFWIAQLTFTFPDQTTDIQDLECKIAQMYREFCYPLQTNLQHSGKVVDRFFYCLPYFFTQAIQDIFIRVFRGNPFCMDRDFRMKLCSLLVELFTGVKPTDSLLKSRLSFYFTRPPEADVPDLSLAENNNCKTVLIPTEDLDTLISMPKRNRPVEYPLKVASISPLISKGLKRNTIPFTHDTNLTITIPKNGETDWTTDLPPLLNQVSDQNVIVDIAKYDPQKETRSLLHRSRRPHVLLDFQKGKGEYLQHQKERQHKLEVEQYEVELRKKRVRKKDPLILDTWIKDLAKLQNEKKHGDTPEFKKLSDILKGSEEEAEKKKQEEKEENDARFNYEPYNHVVPLPSEPNQGEPIKPNYNELIERSIIFDNFRLSNMSKL